MASETNFAFNGFTATGTDPQILTQKVMVGDTGTGGVAGTVPAPAAGDAAAGKFLKANGAWDVPSGGGGGGGGIIYPSLTVPSAPSTWINQGSATATTATNPSRVSVSCPGNNTDPNWRLAELGTLTSGVYTVTVGMSISCPNHNYASFGVYVKRNAGNAFVDYGFSFTPTYGARRITFNSTTSVSGVSNLSMPFGFAGIMFWRIKNTGTLLTGSVSLDGHDFAEISSDSTSSISSFLGGTEDRYGISLANYNASALTVVGSIYHVSVSYP